jgi:CheY-like chemotaxis protein
VQLFEESARNKSLSLLTETELPDDATYMADPERLRQMLANLVSNSIKFTSSGSVRIAVREIRRNGSSATLEFSVSDSGTGIPADKLHLLFKPFSQVDDSSTRQQGGTGLGLAIVQSLAERMNGKTGVESREGEGSRFWFCIQAEVVAMTASATAPAADTLPLIDTDAHSGKPEQLRFAGRILVAEDIPLNIRMAELTLARFGPEVQFVTDGKQAVDAIASGDHFDLVLMDLSMPEMDGLQAAAAVRALEAERGWPRLPIVAFTANAYAEDRLQCQQAGMDDFLAKPLNFKELARVLTRWLPAAEPLQAPAPGLDVINKDAVAAILKTLLPLVDQHMFDAMNHFRQLQELVAVSPGALAALQPVDVHLDALEFEKAAASLRLFARQHDCV